jgi:hypothetical protein
MFTDTITVTINIITILTMATKITIETGRTAAKKGKVIHLKNEKGHTQIHTKTTKAKDFTLT